MTTIMSGRREVVRIVDHPVTTSLPPPRFAWEVSQDDISATLAEVEHMDLVHRALSSLTLRKDSTVKTATLKHFLHLPHDKNILRSQRTNRSSQKRNSKHALNYSKTLPRNHRISAVINQDDADSGYHTGCSTLQSRGPKAAKKPGDWTLTREDLRRSIETFNANNHGLIMSLQSDTNTFQGFIRVHMNLIRPINMSLSTRPTSIYDVVGQGEDEEEFIGGPEDTQITSFYLPKDTTKVIHINSDTTTQEVIKALLSKFKITDNPRKFALYEKVLESDKKASMHRMEEEECPLPLCLCWTTDGIDGLDRRKFVLQENDTGEIMWEAFSLPELENFLRILNREEEEYVEQVKDKYRMLRIHMHRRLQEIQETKALPADPKRKPVFV